MQTQNTYSKDFKWKLYDSLHERNNLFGYDQQNIMRVQENVNNTHFVNNLVGNSCDVATASIEYYNDLRTKQNQKAVIGFTHATPNLYNDNVLPGYPTIEEPNLHKNWKPLVTSAAPVLQGSYVSYTQHEPVEIAPRQNVNFWGADLNARLYERQLVGSAIENPYANFYGRQAMLNLLAKDMPNNNDPYLRKIDTDSESMAYQLKHFGPPATFKF